MSSDRVSRVKSIYILSDGKGYTAKAVADAALRQFSARNYRIKVVSSLRQKTSITKVVKEVADNGGMIFYTIVKQPLRRYLADRCVHFEIKAVDILSPSLNALEDFLKEPPTLVPKLVVDLERDRFARMHAIDYTLNHDDGKNPKGLKHADVVLVGVSRSSKSSTCFFLAYWGICAANVPVYKGTDPGSELLELDPKKIIALTIVPSRLRIVREIAAKHLGLNILDPYTDRKEIAAELRFMKQLIEKHRWQTVDVSFKAIEEVAKEIHDIINIKRHAI